MKWLKNLFAKLFGKKEVARPQPDPVIQLAIPPALPPSFPGTGKFATPPPELPPLVVPTGWPPGAYEFQPGVWYVPDSGDPSAQHGGPFSTPEEAWQWITQVQKWRADSAARDAADKTKVTAGRVSAMAIKPSDAMFLSAANYLFQAQRGSAEGNLWWDFDLLTGVPHEINYQINEGDRLLIQHQATKEEFFKQYNGPFKADVVGIFVQHGISIPV